jgi:hypothetical protein
MRARTPPRWNVHPRVEPGAMTNFVVRAARLKISKDHLKGSGGVHEKAPSPAANTARTARPALPIAIAHALGYVRELPRHPRHRAGPAALRCWDPMRGSHVSDEMLYKTGTLYLGRLRTLGNTHGRTLAPTRQARALDRRCIA